MWQIEFSSDRFLPYLPEECQGNPGVYGFELTLFLSQSLARQGIVTGYPLGEDWGWFIEQLDGDLEFMIACSSHTKMDEGDSSKPIAGSVRVDPRLSIKQRLLRTSADAAVQCLAQAITAAVTADEIAVTEV